ncbi:MAG TPA: bifunctional DNA-binding transcriptional regulator/O6-methylguanine-DNA methyltransferase Ada [Polyangia bacterium]
MISPSQASADDPRWALICARDPKADGRFFYSVATTGVYCRPSCPSRPKRPEHVAFHETARAAEGAGFRPCKRCTPDGLSLAERQAATIAHLCRFIESRESAPSARELAQQAGWSVFHTQRIFKSLTGVTPRAYAAAQRALRMQSALREGSAVTEAIYAAGYSSSGRFYEEASTRLGMTPTRYRMGGTGEVIRFVTGECTLGTVLIATTERGICAILLGDEASSLALDLRRRFPNASLSEAAPDSVFSGLLAQVIGLVDDPHTPALLPLDVRGTAFQQRVWQALRAIPPGSTISYGALATKLGSPAATRAVARACAENPAALVIPCHRVVASNGGLAGYRWGLARKQALLAREAKGRK